MPIKVKLERLTVSQAEKSKDSSQLYVLNKSNPRGNINFVVTDPAGQKVSVQVPVTFIPIDLTVFATREDILRNPDFRRLIMRGFLHIVETESAERFMQDPRAQKEHERVFDVINDGDDLGYEAPIEQQVNAEPPKSDVEVSQFVENILLRTDEDSDSLITELESKFDTMSEQDIQYLMDKTSRSELKAWCAEALEVKNEEE